MLALLVATTGPQFLSLLPLHPLSHPYPHRAQKGPPPGCQDLTGQSAKCRELFKGSSSLALVYRQDDTALTLHRGSCGSKEGKRPKYDTPHIRHCTISSFSHRAASSWCKVPFSRLLQSPMSPKASDPSDRLKPGGTRRRVLLPGHMAGKGSSLSCSTPPQVSHDRDTGSAQGSSVSWGSNKPGIKEF